MLIIIIIILDLLAFLAALNWYYSQTIKKKIVLDIIVAVFSIILISCFFI